MQTITITPATVRGVAGWLRQTSTIMGLSTLLGIVISLVLGEVTFQLAVPVAAGALLAMAMPGHPEAQAVVAKLAVDAVAIANPLTRNAGLKAVASDLPPAVNAFLTVKEEGK